MKCTPSARQFLYYKGKLEPAHKQTRPSLTHPSFSRPSAPTGIIPPIPLPIGISSLPGTPPGMANLHYTRRIQNKTKRGFRRKPR